MGGRGNEKREGEKITLKNEIKGLKIASLRLHFFAGGSSAMACLHPTPPAATVYALEKYVQQRLGWGE